MPRGVPTTVPPEVGLVDKGRAAWLSAGGATKLELQVGVEPGLLTPSQPAPERTQGLLQMATRAKATIIEVAGSHVAYISQPKAVADAIEKAARARE